MKGSCGCLRLHKRIRRLASRLTKHIGPQIARQYAGCLFNGHGVLGRDLPFPFVDPVPDVLLANSDLPRKFRLRSRAANRFEKWRFGLVHTYKLQNSLLGVNRNYCGKIYRNICKMGCHENVRRKAQLGY